MNGFELAGRAMKVGHVTDRTDGQLGGIGGQGGKIITNKQIPENFLEMNPYTFFGQKLILIYF